MVILKILLSIGVVYGLLWVLVPKGNFLYEGMRIPLWLYRLRSFPTGNYKKSKVKYGRHFRQYLLFFQPKEEPVSRRHVVIYIHGGGWQFGRPEQFEANAQALVEEGYAVVMPSHRRLPFFNCLDMREDLALIVKKTLEIMEAESLSDRRIILGGMSSGGNLAALLCFDRSVLESIGQSQALFAGVFLLGAPLDLYQMWSSPPLRMMAGKRKSERFEKACPSCHLQEKESIRTLLMHGDKDGLVEYRSAISFYEKLKSAHSGEIQLATLPGGVHVDAASWCFENHPAKAVLMGWLRDTEKGF